MGDAAQATLPYSGGSDTSKAAAALFKGEAKTARERVFFAISRARTGGGLTDEELQDSLVMNPSTERPRRVELVEAGLVHDCGVRRKTSAGLLSGGQQRMVELERLYMTSPSLILLDEPSLGLSPMLAVEIFERAVAFKDEGVSVVLIDQNIRRAIEIADYVYVLKLGRIHRQGPGRELAEDVNEIVKDMI